MKKIMVVEDDRAIRLGLVELLEAEGYGVCTAVTGAEALEACKKEKPDLILLDIMLPVLNGYDVCREVRKSDPVTPILMLTAKGEEIDKVLGLELGADDYIVKPFGIRELTARVRAGFRRADLAGGPNRTDPIRVMTIGKTVIDVSSLKGDGEGRELLFTKKEMDLLITLYRSRGQAISRESLLEEVWGYVYTGTTRTLDQHVARIRSKIEEVPAEPKHLITVHGVGYQLKV